MGSRILQNPRDHSGLILGSDGSMATGAKRDMQQSSADHGSQVQQPFGKIRGAKVGHPDSRPVEDLLRQPVILPSVTMGVLASRFFRHIHDAISASLLRRMRKVGRRLQNSGADGI